MVSKNFANILFKACNIAKTKNKEIAKLISKKIVVTVKLVVNKVYLETILQKSFNLTSDIKLSISSIDLSLDKGLKTDKILFSYQLF